MNEKKCKLCFKESYDEFQTVEDLENSLIELLFKLKLDITKETLMCYECMANIQASLNFISNYIYMKDSTRNSVNVYLGQSNNTNNIDSVECRAQKKCHFCTNSAEVENFLSLNESKENMFLISILNKRIPELNLYSTEELLTCTTCLYRLQSLLSMINYLDGEQKLKDYTKIEEMENKDQVEFKNVQFTFESTVKSDIEYSDANEVGGTWDGLIQDPVIKVEMGVNDKKDLDEELNIKTEEFEIKSEQNDDESFQDAYAEVTKDNDKSCSLQSEMCTFSPASQADLENHSLTHETPSNISTYKCEECTYRTKYKGNFNKHILTHKHPSEVKMHECELCTFKTKYKAQISRHMLIHKSPSEIIWHKCEICTFETKRKSNLTSHVMLVHTFSEIKMYKCDTCQHETNNKSRFNRHMKTHENPSEVTMYKCEMCAFETIERSYLTQHMLTHKDPSEITMYKCEICALETKRKKNLMRHMLTHKNPSEMTMYPCGICSYVTKHERYLKNHMMTHKDVSQVTTYKCKICTHETKYKSSLKRHMEIHKQRAS